MYLNTQPLDLSSADLGVRFNAPMPPRILAESVLSAPGAQHQLHLGIIGGSHVVTFIDAHGTPLLREELSCYAVENGQRLARGVETQEATGELHYSFAAAPKHVAAAQFDEVVEYLQRRAEHEHWLVGEFPGEELGHITALAATWRDNTNVRWQTWHLYPLERVVVVSLSAISVGTIHKPIEFNSLHDVLTEANPVSAAQGIPEVVPETIPPTYNNDGQPRIEGEDGKRV